MVERAAGSLVPERSVRSGLRARWNNMIIFKNMVPAGRDKTLAPSSLMPYGHYFSSIRGDFAVAHVDDASLAARLSVRGCTRDDRVALFVQPRK